ncbi:tRNA (adenosine(37)-N6)-threonylcarbamoyltransferase complex dimerization subunit type 1 TsaB [Microbacterium halophytorum]|uniref:tRNA (adenosine(37)-N6)-threonylcarbamoyltransferase complex dimerization subunit type 1 TsaB n=1 Tax=Microbacterium halophytorum TaxID=2067568 RepID=UPI000CFC0D9D|nr:tRNA (adenosine(37)-N6)-threonylcarbamoyltransferase complex dimerization subunit type 1 TsaB [Microbacterium halophytorum]
MILAVDTSIGSTVALVSPAGDVLAEANSPSPRGHAEVIGDLLVAAFERAGIAPDAVTHVAAGMGPGPFTGLRIGIAAARAFAAGRGLPVVPVASHDAPALAHAEVSAQDAFAIVTDARRRENAVSVYRGLDDSGLPARASGPELHPQTADLAAALSGVEIVHAGAAPAEPSDAGAAAVIRAADLGRVAARMLAAGVEPRENEPLYLRSPDVTVNHTRKRVST